MGEMKFASVDEAIQHLSNLTSKRVKIAWKDESRQMVKLIADSIAKKPGLLSAIKKSGALNVDELIKGIEGIDPNAKILPTNKGQLKIVQDIPEGAAAAMAEKISGIKDLKQRSKLIDAVSGDKAFEEFHAKYPKGVQKDENGPYYRSKAGLLQKGMDFLKRDKGEEGTKDVIDRKKLEEEEKEEAAAVREAVGEVAKEAAKGIKDLEDTKAKKIFNLLLKKPSNPIFQNKFIDAFKADIADEKIDEKDAAKYLEIVEDIADFAQQAFGGKLPEFAKSLRLLVPVVDKAEDAAKSEVPGDVKTEEKGTKTREVGKTPTGTPLGLVENASEADSMISNIVDEWLNVNLS